MCPTESHRRPEASGGRFAVLFHETASGVGRADHWDFMLEVEGVLRTWALEAEPSCQDGLPIPATALADHRLEYLQYEGPLTGGRGSVTSWDRGEFQVLKWSEVGVEVRLSGARLRGLARLERRAESERGTGDEAAADQRASFVFTFEAER